MKDDGTNFNYPTARATAILEWLSLVRYIAPRCHPATVNAALRFDEESEAALYKLSRYALFELRFSERNRPLTAYEVQMRSIAERLYDVMKPRTGDNLQ